MKIGTPLNDPHNFGTQVYLASDALISKPRSTFWEKLFLSSNEFRHSVDEIFNNADLRSPFKIFPILNFYSLPSAWIVERLVLAECVTLSPDEARALGAAVAIVAWYGILDLNVENVMIGRIDNRFVFAPIDIEIIGGDISFLSQATLISNVQVPDHKCALYSVLELLRSQPQELIPPLCQGYLETLELCKVYENKLDKLLAKAINSETDSIIRVVFRKTASYLNFTSGKSKSREFEIAPFKSELEQMNRGDIPYYFKLPDASTVFHYSSPGCAVESDMNHYPSDNLVFMRNISGVIDFRKHLESLTTWGVLQLARAAITHSKSFAGDFLDTQIRSDGKEIFLSRNQLRIKTTRAILK